MKKSFWGGLAVLILCLLAMAWLYTKTGTYQRQVAQMTGYSKVCVDGVQYLQFISGAAVQVDLNGKPVACK